MNAIEKNKKFHWVKRLIAWRSYVYTLAIFAGLLVLFFVATYSACDCERSSPGGNGERLQAILLGGIVLWLLQNIFTYSLSRYHCVRLLKADIDGRWLGAQLAAEHLDQWVEKNKNKTRNYETLLIARENHLVYPSLQGPLRLALWGGEIPAVRYFYQCMEEVELRAGIIADHYKDLDLTGAGYENKNKNRIFKEIKSNKERITGIIGAWSKVYDESEKSVGYIRKVVARWVTDEDSAKKDGVTQKNLARKLVANRFPAYFVLLFIPVWFTVTVAWVYWHNLQCSKTSGFFVCISAFFIIVSGIVMILFIYELNKKQKFQSDVRKEIISKKVKTPAAQQ
ncbi:hypothetical protein ACS8Y6_15490 [Salinisphaera sp. RV14]|uniref:hypothetical protein n=1 Tax=unclassified Salinisphaera TaxID=2649847 RepID=UPI003F828D0F